MRQTNAGASLNSMGRLAIKIVKQNLCQIILTDITKIFANRGDNAAAPSIRIHQRRIPSQGALNMNNASKTAC
jgi:hypothetical protein